jgi:hypothetical protein
MRLQKLHEKAEVLRSARRSTCRVAAYGNDCPLRVAYAWGRKLVMVWCQNDLAVTFYKTG